MTESSDLQAKAAALEAREAEAGGPGAIIDSLVAGLEKQHRTIVWLWVSIALDVLLSLVLTAVALFAVHTANKVQSNSSITHTSCLAGNEFRSNDRALWDFVLKLPIPADETVARRATRIANTAALNSFLDVTFKLRVCP